MRGNKDLRSADSEVHGGVKYKRIGHYKYELAELFRVQTGIRPVRDYYAPNIIGHYVSLFKEGSLLLGKGYAWDGASGPAMDTKSIMRGALVHDGLYQLMREGGLPLSCRKPADKLLRKMCREDGMFWIRVWWVYLAVRIFGKEAASGTR